MPSKIGLLLICLFIVTSERVASSPKHASPAEYEVYALSYGVYPNYGISNLVAGADKNRKIDLQMMIWLLKGPGGRNILVDSGCYHDRFVKNLGIKNYTKPSETLERLGMSASDITDVIISHMHWDHADGMDLFPRAKIWIQKDEFSYYTGAAASIPKTS
jgi:glyoxylase-like metal-dependent hydrolase (beta-lactamase superfamily II)